MRKFYHSYYSLPTQNFNRWGIQEQFRMNLFLAALSVEFLHKHNREAILICDRYSKEYMQHIPYDGIYTMLEGLHVPKYFWAAGKVFAQKFIDRGDVHVDTDVFFLSDRCINMIDKYEFDVVAQELEITALDIEHQGNWYKRHYDFLTSHKVEINPNKYALNCGVIGFNDRKLKKRYIAQYSNFAKKVSKINPEKYDGGLEFYAPDLILEQMNLCNVIDEHNAKVLVIRPNNDYLSDFKDDYLHLIGQLKYSEERQNWVKDQLQELNPALLEKLNNL